MIGEKEVQFYLRLWAIWKSIFRNKQNFESLKTRKRLWEGLNGFGVKLSGLHLKIREAGETSITMLW